jgi:hypothetical protein
MDCHGKGKALKLAEIAAGLVVAGELSLGSGDEGRQGRPGRTSGSMPTNAWAATARGSFVTAVTVARHAFEVSLTELYPVWTLREV